MQEGEASFKGTEQSAQRLLLTTRAEAASPGEQQRPLAVRLRAASGAAHCPAVSTPRCLFIPPATARWVGFAEVFSWEPGAVSGVWVGFGECPGYHLTCPREGVGECEDGERGGQGKVERPPHRLLRLPVAPTAHPAFLSLSSCQPLLALLHLPCPLSSSSHTSML